MISLPLTGAAASGTIRAAGTAVIAAMAVPVLASAPAAAPAPVLARAPAAARTPAPPSGPVHVTATRAARAAPETAGPRHREQLRDDGHGWGWPLRPVPRVVRPFVPPDRPWGPGHRGVDLDARPGAVVRAAGAGRVAFAGSVAGRSVVVIDHGRLRTTYLPVEPSVRAGRPVRAGDPIGTLQDAPEHCPSGSCLHWGLRDALRYLDPLSLLTGGPVRLLPVWPASGPRGAVADPPRGALNGPP